ncbi:hypothetical protein ABT329_17380, partial [Streptomyces minutiscleroticus]
ASRLWGAWSSIMDVYRPDGAGDVASFGLGRGWWLLGVLVLVGFVAGLLWGWLSRWRVAVWRTN